MPKWVHDCIRRYEHRGISKREAERRCHGAYARQGGKCLVCEMESTVYRAADGTRYMLLVSSNGYKDREQEWVKVRALKRYVESAYKDDVFQRQPFYFWHDEDYGFDHPIGELIHAEMIGPFLLEIAEERKGDDYSQGHWDWLEATDEPQGASIGFRYVTRNFRNHAYDAIEKFETSTLPLEAAANLLTYSGVMT